MRYSDPNFKSTLRLVDRILWKIVFTSPYREFFRKAFPSLFFLFFHRLALQNTENLSKEHKALFETFLNQTANKKCLQIGVKDVLGGKFGPNWVSIDKYDKSSFIDYNYDVHDMEFADEEFYAVVCWSILEHVPHPEKAIQEMRRVLKPGGLIWVQLPFNFPYHEAPKDYWRVTPDGLRIWMKDFEEIRCGVDAWAKTPLITATFFYGKKPPNNAA